MKVQAPTVYALLLAALLPISLISGGCSDDGDEGSGDQPAEATAAAAALCTDIVGASVSLKKIESSLIPPDPATLATEQAKLRAHLDSMAVSSERSGGGTNDEVTALVNDLVEFQKLLAVPNLLSVAGDLSAQITTISIQMEELSESAGCS